MDYAIWESGEFIKWEDRPDDTFPGEIRERVYANVQVYRIRHMSFAPYSTKNQ